MGKKETTLAKGIAILMIILYHLQYDLASLLYLIERGEGIIPYLTRITGKIAEDPIHIIPFLYYLGFAAVNVFFILSGFGLTKKYLAEELTLRKWLKQIMKILIPYFLAIPLTFLINYLLQYFWFQQGIITVMPQPFEIYLPSQYWESLLVFTRWFDNRLALNFVGTWWFVGIILQFYLLFPVLLKIYKKIKAKNFLILAIGIGTIYRLYMAYNTEASPVGIMGAQLLEFINFPARLPEFALGMYLASNENWFKQKNLVLFGLWFFILGIVLSTFVWGFALNDLLLGLGLIMLITKVVNKLQVNEHNPLYLFGKYSYQIYLLHEPALKMIAKLFFPQIT